MSDTNNKLCHRRPKFKQYFYSISDSGDINVTLDMSGTKYKARH
jgi:hypothetical protein